MPLQVGQYSFWRDLNCTKFSGSRHDSEYIKPLELCSFVTKCFFDLYSLHKSNNFYIIIYHTHILVEKISQSLRWYNFLCDLSGFVVSCFTWWNHRPLECGFAPFRWTCVVPQLGMGRSTTNKATHKKTPHLAQILRFLVCFFFFGIFCVCAMPCYWLFVEVYILTVIFSSTFRRFFRRKKRELAHHKRMRSSQSESDSSDSGCCACRGCRNWTFHKSWLPSQQEIQQWSLTFWAYQYLIWNHPKVVYTPCCPSVWQLRFLQPITPWCSHLRTVGC